MIDKDRLSEGRSSDGPLRLWIKSISGAYRLRERQPLVQNGLVNPKGMC